MFHCSQSASFQFRRTQESRKKKPRRRKRQRKRSKCKKVWPGSCKRLHYDGNESQPSYLLRLLHVELNYAAVGVIAMSHWALTSQVSRNNPLVHSIERGSEDLEIKQNTWRFGSMIVNHVYIVSIMQRKTTSEHLLDNARVLCGRTLRI